jgi:hypothetical protein
MPRNAKPKKSNSRSGPRTPPGKKQMLVILEAMLIRDLKVAMAEDGTAASHVIGQLARKWLVKRKEQRARNIRRYSDW